MIGVGKIDRRIGIDRGIIDISIVLVSAPIDTYRRFSTPKEIEE